MAQFEPDIRELSEEGKAVLTKKFVVPEGPQYKNGPKTPYVINGSDYIGVVVETRKNAEEVLDQIDCIANQENLSMDMKVLMICKDIF